jgi:hypothetical protein
MPVCDEVSALLVVFRSDQTRTPGAGGIGPKISLHHAMLKYSHTNKEGQLFSPPTTSKTRFTHGPSLGSHWGVDCAFLVRRKTEDSLAWRVQKTFEINGNHPRKRACGRFGCLHLFPTVSVVFCCARASGSSSILKWSGPPF